MDERPVWWLGPSGTLGGRPAGPWERAPGLVHTRVTRWFMALACPLADIIRE